MKNIRSFAVKNRVPLIFGALCAVCVAFRNVNGAVIVSDVVSRFARNGFFVLSLLFPLAAGMGLNFGIVLGAMAARIAVFVVTVMNWRGTGGVVAACVISVPIAVVFGLMSAALANRTKGREMLSSMFVGYFANGLYLIFFLYVLGGIIKINAPRLMIPGTGVGVRTTIDLDGIKYALDDLLRLDLFAFIGLAGAVAAFWRIYKSRRKKSLCKKEAALAACLLALCAAGYIFPGFAIYNRIVKVPVVTYRLIGLLCLFINRFFKTALGRNMRAVGRDMKAAAAAGIDVDGTRTIATVLSVVISAIGQIIFLQNLGNLSVYSAHQNVGMFASAALLIGGSTVKKGGIGQALLGTFLFHLLFNVSPTAGQNIFGSALIGEYFRVFIAYGVIAVAVALHARQERAGKSAS